jgi:hypothetical protein
MSGNVDREFVGESKRQRTPLRTSNDGEYSNVTLRRFFLPIVVIHIHQIFYLLWATFDAFFVYPK